MVPVIATINDHSVPLVQSIATLIARQRTMLSSLATLGYRSEHIIQYYHNYIYHSLSMLARIVTDQGLYMMLSIDSFHSIDSYFPLEYRSAILMVKNQ